MALFADILAEVAIWTKRPDLVNNARLAIRDQTLKYHRRHKFFKDIAVLSVASPSSASGVAIIPLSSIPQWRQFVAIQGGDSLGPVFKIVSAEDLLDVDGYLQFQIAFVAGATLNIKGIAGYSHYLISYYADPIVVENTYDSWIAREYPGLIAAGAAARVLAGDNESEIYKAAKQEEAEQWATLVSSNLEAEGR